MHRGKQAQGHDACLVPPMFKGVSRVTLGMSPQGVVGIGNRVRTKPGVQRHVMSAGQHIDGVELQHTLSVEVVNHMQGAGPAGWT